MAWNGDQLQVAGGAPTAAQAAKRLLLGFALMVKEYVDL